MNKSITIAFLLMLSLLTGCASVPMASLDEDLQAKKFTADPAKAQIYVYRNEALGGAIAIPVTLDGKVAGKTGPDTYFYWSVEPGVHEVTSLTENTAKIAIDTKQGRHYYVWQEIKMGMWVRGRNYMKCLRKREGKGLANVK